METETGTAKVYSGTRLDIRAINGVTTQTKKFIVAPPQYPVADLPLSFVADTIILPLTVNVALYEALFE